MCPNLYCISMPSHVPRISLLSCLDLYFSEHMLTCVNITNEPHLRQILNLNKPRITYSTAWCSHGLANLSNICENMDPVKTVYQKITSLSPNVSTTPITVVECRQCLLLSIVQLKGKHCRKPPCRNGVVDAFGVISLKD